MNYTILKKSGLSHLIKVASVCFSLLQCIPLIALAEGNDQEIFNQLYQEIINSKTIGNPGKTDSMNSPRTSESNDQKTVLPIDNADIHGTEQLRDEIEKIVKDIQLRHSDAVKFMQNDK